MRCESPVRGEEEIKGKEEGDDELDRRRGSCKLPRSRRTGTARRRTYSQSPDFWLVVIKYQGKCDNKGRPQAEKPGNQRPVDTRSRQIAESLFSQESRIVLLFKLLVDVVLLSVEVVWDPRVARARVARGIGKVVYAKVSTAWRRRGQSVPGARSCPRLTGSIQVSRHCPSDTSQRSSRHS